MPRQATRSAARGPLDKLRGPVRKMAEEVFSVDTDRAVLKDEPLLNGLSELQTKQAIKVLETYCANVQRQGSGRIQNKAAYLMSLIQSYKLGPSSGNPGSAQRLVERLSPAVRRAVEGVFDPVVDRVVLEDRALMELLAKVPEEQALAALKKYRATVQRRGRDAIDNRCGYLIGFLKQYQDGVAVVGPSGSGQPSRAGPFASSNGDGPSPANSSTHQSSSASNGHHPMTNGTRNGGANGSGGPSPATVPASGTQAGGNGGGGSGVRPISYLQPPVRKQLEKLFESGKDKAVLEDVGLIKQLARLGEEQALAALKNYKEASKHRRDIHNKSAYLMGILRGYIEGTTPITKAPWEGRGNDEGSDAVTSSSSVPQPSSGASGNRARGRGRGPGTTVDDAERSTANSMPRAQVVPPQHPQVQQPQTQQPQLPQPQLAQPQMPQAQLAQQQQEQLPAPSAAPPLSISGPLGGFTTPPAQPQQPASPHEALHVPLAAIASTPSTSPLNSPLLGGGGLFINGIGHNGSGADTSRRYEPSSSLIYLDGGGGGGMPGFGSQANPPDHDKPPRHSSQHESLFGNPSSGDQVGQQHPLVGPGLLGGEFLVNGGGSDRGVGLTGGLSHATSHAHANTAHSNHALFGSGLLAADQFEISNGGLSSNAPTSPGSRSAQGSTSGLGSSSLSAAGSGEESPLGSDSGNDVQTVISTATGTSTGPSGAGAPTFNDLTDCPSGISPRSGEGTENSSNSNGGEGGMADMLARLNLSKYVPVLAEAEVDMDALRLFGEDDLKDLGFPKGPRIKLLHEVQNLNFTPMA